MIKTVLVRIKRLYSMNKHQDVNGATAEFELQLCDEEGRVVSVADIERFEGKIGEPMRASDYCRELPVHEPNVPPIEGVVYTEGVFPTTKFKP